MRAGLFVAFAIVACGRTDLDFDDASSRSPPPGAGTNNGAVDAGHDAGKPCEWHPRSPATYPGGVAPSTVAIGDLNGDGNADIAVNNYGVGTAGLYVQTLRNQGDTTFTVDTTIPSTVAFSMAIGPFVSSDADLLVGCDLFANNGDGTFAPTIDYGSRCGFQNSWANLATADFDGDGERDFAWGLGSEVVVYLNRRQGVFREVDTQFSDDTPYSTTLASADFDRDGHIDLAAASTGYGNPNIISVLYGRGDGTFDVTTIDMGDTLPQAIAAGDVNGDGLADLVLSTAAPWGVEIRPRRAAGTFGAPTAVASSAWGDLGILLGDLDGDGDSDIVAIDSYTDQRGGVQGGCSARLVEHQSR